MINKSEKVTKKDSNNHNLLHWKVRLKYAFDLRMFRYSLIKQLKSISTYIFVILLFLVNIGIILGLSLTISADPTQPAGSLEQVIKQAYQIYLWIYFIIFFSIFSMFIAFKSVQLIRDEIDDGTLLIFSAMPLTRSKMIIEKWLSLQVTALIFILITCLIAPGFAAVGGSSTLAVVKLIYQNVFFLILTAFIVEILLSTLAILISLSVSAKGTIGILAIIGVLSVFGGIIPFIFNGVNSSSSGAQVIQGMNYREKQFKQIKGSLPKDLETKLFDYTAWPFWRKNDIPGTGKVEYDYTYYGTGGLGSYNGIKQFYDIKYSTIESTMVNILNSDASINNGQELFEKMAHDTTFGGKALFDQWAQKKFSVDNMILKPFVAPNMAGTANLNHGLGIFDQLYQVLRTGTQNNFSIDKINFNYQNYANTNITDSGLKSLNNFIQAMYKAGINNDTPLVLDTYSDFSSVIDSDIRNDSSLNIPNSFERWTISSFFEQFRRDFLDGEYSWRLYNTDPIYNYIFTAANNFVNFMFGSSIAFNEDSSSVALDKASSALNKNNSTLNVYKLLGYFNIWQQWLTMWTNDERAQVSSFGGNSLPINVKGSMSITTLSYERGLGEINAIYMLHPDWENTSDIINLTILYISYILVSLSLAILSIWFVTRKDFV